MKPACFGTYSGARSQPCHACHHRPTCSSKAEAGGFRIMSVARPYVPYTAPALTPVDLPRLSAIRRAVPGNITTAGVLKARGEKIATISVRNATYTFKIDGFPPSVLYEIPASSVAHIRATSYGSAAVIKTTSDAAAFAKDLIRRVLHGRDH